MENKKLVTYLLVIGIGLLLGIIAGIINDYTRYIIIFAYLLGIAGGFVYNFILLKNNFNAEDKKFINFGIIIFIITILSSINITDYHQMKSFFNESLKEISNNPETYVNNIYEEIKKLPNNFSNYQKDVDNITNSISSKDYKTAVNYENVFLTDYEENNGITAKSDGMYGKLVVLDIYYSSKKGDNNFDSFLNDNTGADGYFGYWLFGLFSSGIVESKGKEIDTGFLGSIIIYLLDIIALWYGVRSRLDILKKSVCKIHHKIFEQFGETYIFPTILNNFNGLSLDNILEKINTLPSEKGGFFTPKPKTYYCDISFSKCGECELGSTETNIDIIINHNGLSKDNSSKTTISNFHINTEKYTKLNEKLKAMTSNNQQLEKAPLS